MLGAEIFGTFSANYEKIHFQRNASKSKKFQFSASIEKNHVDQSDVWD